MRHRAPLDLRRARRGGRRRRPRAARAAASRVGDRVGIWSPNCAEWTLVQYATAQLGVVLVTINPAYRTPRAGLRAAAVRRAAARRAPSASGPATTGRWSSEVRGECPALEHVVLLGTPDWDGAARRRPVGVPAEAVARAVGGAVRRTTRSTSSTRRGRPASRRARRSRTTTSSTTASSSASSAAYTEADRVCIPVPFYHCFGMVMGNLACTSHGAAMVVPGARVRPAGDAAGRAGRALHLAVRRADDVHRRARLPRVRPLRPVVAAHRDHGRLALPGGGDEAGRRRHGHDRGDHLLRHDRDLAGVDADPQRRRPGPAGLDRRPRPPAPGGEGRRPGDRARRCAAGSRGSCAPAATR